MQIAIDALKDILTLQLKQLFLDVKAVRSTSEVGLIITVRTEYLQTFSTLGITEHN